MWTPEKEARLAELESSYYGAAPQSQAAPAQPTMGLTQRFARHVGNIPAWFVNAGQSIGDTLLDTDTAPKQLFDIPQAQTAGERAVDVAGTLTQELAGLATGSGLLTKGARLLRAGKAAPIIGDTATGAISGLRESGAESGLQAGEFGASGAILSALGSRSPIARALIGGAANLGVGVAGQAIRGNELDSPEALGQMATLALFPAAQEAVGAAGRRLFRRAEPPTVSANVDEVIPPDGNQPLALEDRRLMLEGPSAYGQSATDRRFRMVDEPYTPTPDVIRMGRNEPLMLEAPRSPSPVKRAAFEEPTIIQPEAQRPSDVIDAPFFIEPTIQRQATAQRIDAENARVAAMTPEQRMALGLVSPRRIFSREPISPQPTGTAPALLRSGEPASPGGEGGRLKPLRGSQAGAVNPNLLGGMGGAVAGAALDPDDPLQGALVGAAIGVGGAQGARLLRSAKLREAADQQMRGEKTAFGKIAREMEKNLNLGKSSRLTALDDRAKGEADFWAKRMDTALKGAGKMAYGENLTPAQKTAGEAFIASKGDSVDVAKLRAAGLPEEYRNYLETAKDAQKQMQGILMRAESDPKKQNLIANTLGTYQTRQYRYFLQPEEFKLDPAKKAAVANEWKSNPIFAGVDPAIVDDVVARDLDQHLRELSESGGDFSRLANEGKSKISQSLFKGRKDLTPNYRSLLGEVTDKHEAQVLTANKLLQSVAQAKVIGDLRTAKDSTGNRFSMSQQEWQSELSSAKAAGDTAKQQFLLNRYVDAPDSPGIGALAGQKVQRQVADYFQFAGHKGLESGNNSWYAQLNQIPKAVFTRLNIGTWVRNYGQSVLQGHALGVWNPGEIIKTAWRLSKDKDLLDDVTRGGVLGGHAGRHEFGQQAAKLGDSLKGGFKARAKALMNMINEGYGKPDNWVRATAYLRELDTNLAKGLSREEAGLKALEFVNRYSVNYGQVSKLVGKARNIPVVNPFISYSAEMARVLKNLAEDVVTGSERAVQSGLALTSLMAVPVAISYAAKEFNLTDAQKKELGQMEEIMPPYMRGRLNLALGADDKGNFTQANMQPWLPAGDFVSMARNILRGDAEALITQNPIASTAGTPLLNAYQELRTGKDTVTGRNVGPIDIFRKNAIPMDYRIREVARSFTPNEEGGLGVTDNAGRQTTPGSAIAGLFGFSTTNTSKKRLLRRVEAEIQDEISDAKRKMTEVLRTNATPEIKAAARAEFQEEKRRLLFRKREILSGVQSPR